MTIGGILDSLVIGFLHGKEPLPDESQLLSGSHGIVKRAASVAKEIVATLGSYPLYIVLHNIDGRGLRNLVAQSALASLAIHGVVDNVRHIRILASFDNVNAPAFLWDTRTNAAFSWVS